MDPTTGALTPAIHLASTFERDEDLEYRREFIYGRVGNPTRALLERTLADLEAGSGALSFASGVAVAASVFQCFPGGCVIIPEDIYHGNRTLLRTVFAEWGLRVEEVDMTSLGAVEALLKLGADVTQLLPPPPPPATSAASTRSKCCGCLAEFGNVLLLGEGTGS